MVTSSPGLKDRRVPPAPAGKTGGAAPVGAGESTSPPSQVSRAFPTQGVPGYPAGKSAHTPASSSLCPTWTLHPVPGGGRSVGEVRLNLEVTLGVSGAPRAR